MQLFRPSRIPFTTIRFNEFSLSGGVVITLPTFMLEPFSFMWAFSFFIKINPAEMIIRPKTIPKIQQFSCHDGTSESLQPSGSANGRLASRPLASAL
jgi:hypothetical protein